MKKIALTIVALSTLGLAACNSNSAANNAANAVQNAGENAVADVHEATNEMRNEAANLTDGAQDQANQALESTVNVADATTSAIANETTK